MGELEVRYRAGRLVLSVGQRLGFGRCNTDPATPRGWGYDGRFIELSTDSHLHRIWGEIVCEGGLWTVRSLGTLHPVVVVPDGQRPIELAPLRDGGEPSAYAATRSRFDVVLSVGSESYELRCAAVGPAAAPPPGQAAAGPDTVTLGLEMADCVTATEFVVLWEMSREFRSDPPAADPQPLSYSRIMRSLGLTERQAVSAVARVVQRFRARELMPDEVPATEQRAWLCRQLLAHRVVDELVRRHGDPDDGRARPDPTSSGQ